MADYSVTLSTGGGYILDRAFIEQAVDLIGNFTAKSPSIEITFRNETVTKFAKPAQIWNDIDISSHYIKAITIQADCRYELTPHPRPARFATIRASNSILDALSVSLEGDRDATLALRTTIADLIRSRRQFYAFLHADLKLATLLFVQTVAAIVSIIATIIIGKLTAPAYLDAAPGPIITVGVLVFFALFYTARRLLFPKMLFDVGRSANSVARAKLARVTLGSGIILSFLIGVATTVFTDSLKSK